MKKKKTRERRLTAAEQRRKERFEAQKALLARQGYAARDLTVSAVWANLFALILMLPFVLLFAFWYLWINGTLGGGSSVPELLGLLASALALTALHELIHGLVWGCFASGGFRSIEFGVVWAALAPYCTCGETMKKWQYALGSAMPTLILGFGLGVVCIYTGWRTPFLLSLLMILGGGGDFCILLRLLCFRPEGEAIYCDHPYELGLVVFERPAGSV